MNAFAEALQDLERRGVMPLRVPSLGPTREALARLGLFERIDPRRVILVAGTNGKGSTSKTLETLLLDAGRRTGLYVSPHLVDYRERISVGGQSVTPEDFVQAWQAVATATSDLMLSHFEMLTVMAAWIFFAGVVGEPVQDAIFEVGLGGIWDATNAIPHRTAVICRLGLDHQDLLGSSIVEIARNKFGIVSQDAVVIHLPLPEEVQSLKTETERVTDSRWIEASGAEARVDASGRIPRFFLNSRWGQTEISLPGLRGAENMNLALHAFEALGQDPASHLHALAHVVWPARMQRLEVADAPCPVYLSGDHNPQGIESLLEILGHFKYERLRLVVGVGTKKDLDGILAPLLARPSTDLWLTRASFQGRSREQYGSWLQRSHGFFENPLRALSAALRGASAEDLCVITGSLYLAGDVLKLLAERGTEWNALSPR